MDPESQKFLKDFVQGDGCVAVVPVVLVLHKLLQLVVAGAASL